MNLYKKWDEGEWGMIITGNVQVDSHHIGLPFDARLSYDEGEADNWRALAGAVKNTPLIAQLNHPGAQSPRWTLSKSPLLSNVSASARQHTFPHSTLFADSRAMSAGDIYIVVKQFVVAAKYLQEMGFDGIQVHA